MSKVLHLYVCTCEERRGSAAFKSNNVSTVAVIRDVISNCSVKKGIRVEVSCDVPDDCCLKSFENLKEIFKVEYQKNKDTILMKAISSLDLDISMVNNEMTVLCDDYQRVWKCSDTVEQWYIDWCNLTLQGGDHNSEKKKLRDALRECKIEEVFKIFSKEHLSLQAF